MTSLSDSCSMAWKIDDKNQYCEDNNSDRLQDKSDGESNGEYEFDGEYKYSCPRESYG